MKRLFATISALIAFALSITAQEMRTITDDAGTEVSIPVKPQRIITLHDLVLTVPLIELGIHPVGSHGRGETQNKAFIRSSLTLTGVDFDNSNIEWMGNNPADVEKVAKLQPDLILTTAWQGADVKKLRAIAPTVVFDTSVRSDWEIYEFLADVTGTLDKLKIMQRRYENQISLIRQVIDTKSISVSTIHAYEGQLFAYNPYSNIGKVLKDAGFQEPEVITSIPEGDYRDFSPETLPQFDADFIITTYRSSAGDGPKEVNGYFEGIVPGYCKVLHACREGQMIMASRAEASATSFYALGSVAYMILTEIGGKPFVPMSR